MQREGDMNSDETNTKKYRVVDQIQADGIKIVIEMPEPNKKRDKEVIKEIQTIMNNEILSWVKKKISEYEKKINDSNF